MRGTIPCIFLFRRYYFNMWIGATADARITPVQVTIEHVDIKIKLEVLVPFSTVIDTPGTNLQLRQIKTFTYICTLFLNHSKMLHLHFKIKLYKSNCEHVPHFFHELHSPTNLVSWLKSR